MNLRDHKIFAGIVSALLLISFCMFVIPEPASAFSAEAGTVIIESDMDEKMPIEEIVVIYGAISAEKHHQESMGRDVIIDDGSPRRSDPKEQVFIEDMKDIIGREMFSGDRTAPQPPNDMPEAVNDCADISGNVQHTSEYGKRTSDDRDRHSVDTEDIDRTFMIRALALADDNGIDIAGDQGYISAFLSKIIITISYADIQSADTSGKDDECQEEDCVAIISEDEDFHAAPETYDIFESFRPYIHTAVPGDYNTGAVTCGIDF